MARKAIPQKVQLAVLKRDCYARCAKCKHLFDFAALQMDHEHPVALGGTNDPDNIQLLCQPCHKIKTGGTKATSHGSDIHGIAKTKRLAELREAQERGEKKASKHKWAKRPIPKRADPWGTKRRVEK